MLFEQIESKGLAHYSYLIGDETEAVVIDPRRDADIYVRKAQENAMDIETVLETHRNEDTLVGSLEVQRQTGADIWHADGQLPYQYGSPTQDGQRWKVGRLQIEALSTPGHTPGSFSYLLYDAEGNPWAVFTGDALFAGDVGRVDFLGEDHIPEMAGKLYESLFSKILSLDDGVLVCPAHGAGSACGFDIAERRISSIGIEKDSNPRLQHPDREAFVADVGEVLDKAPYFSRMEKYNMEGAPLLGDIPTARALGPAQFARELESEDTLVVDIRSEFEFASSHIDGSMFIFQDGLEEFAGLFVPLDAKILLVNDGKYPDDSITRLRRIGFDDVAGYLAGGMNHWLSAGHRIESTSSVSVQDLCTLLDGSGDYWLLDVRTEEELLRNGVIEGAYNIPIPSIRERMDEIPRDEDVYIFCGSGLRATIVASILQRAGYQNTSVIFGGVRGWSSTSCPIVDR